MAASPNQAIRVAVNGGGLAGASLARFLLKKPGLEVNVYESAPEFSERGAAVGIALNGLQAMELMGKDVRAAIDKAGGVESNSNRVCMGSGPSAGELVIDLGADYDPAKGPSEVIAHRAQFLQELLRDIPASHLHVSKKLVGIAEKADSTVELRFADGTHAEADVVIGADGIHGPTRAHVLGASDPAVKPVFSGFWDCRNLTLAARGTELLGKKYVDRDDPHQHMWVGAGGFFLHSIISGTELMQCVASTYVGNDWPSEEWKTPLSKEQLASHFDSSWKVRDSMVELLGDQPDLTAFAEYEHRDAQTYSNRHVCIMGDAAHAMTPWQGSGASQALEDALVLGTLLGEATNANADIPKSQKVQAALEAYDTMRRPRSQRVVASSNATGLILTGHNPEIGADKEKMRKALETRWKWIHFFDLQAHCADALQNYHGLLKQS